MSPFCRWGHQGSKRLSNCLRSHLVTKKEFKLRSNCLQSFSILACFLPLYCTTVFLGSLNLISGISDCFKGDPLWIWICMIYHVSSWSEGLLHKNIYSGGHLNLSSLVFSMAWAKLQHTRIWHALRCVQYTSLSKYGPFNFNFLEQLKNWYSWEGEKKTLS